MLGRYIDAVDRRRKRFTVYRRGDEDLADRLATRNVTVEYRQLPPVGPDPFVTIHGEDGFAGAIALDDLQHLLAPPVVRPGNPEDVSESYRALLDVLEETLFATLDRRQLLATSREFEDRALRVGHGTLRAGFQSLSNFRAQADVYRRLGARTALDIHIYGRPDRSPPEIDTVTYHVDADGALAPFWFLTFDGGHDEQQACTLVAREDLDGYVGFWSYDPGLVADVASSIRTVE